MEIENKLDEDFVFYLGFMSPFLSKISDGDLKTKCELWLQKLCGEKCDGVDRKRCRNIYLSQLLICMQKGELVDQFQISPNEIDIADAFDVFELVPPDEENPEWLNDNDPQWEEPDPRNGRTYMATRTLPDGQGAMAYIALSLGEDESMWMGAGEGLDKHFEEKYNEYVPDYEMERILARRKDPKEREKVVTYFQILLTNIADELDEKMKPEENEGIIDIMDQLIQDLKEKDCWCKYEAMDEKTRRHELLLLLHERIISRIQKTLEREEVLDDIERNVMTKSFFDTSATEKDRAKLPANMWEQAINKAPNKRNLDKLQNNYPLSVIEKFLELLADYKEEIALRMQRRFENIISQMKKEVRREGEKGNKIISDLQKSYEAVLDMLKSVREAYNRKMEAERKNKEKMHIPQTEHSKMYDEMRAALFDTQKSVEEEAARGRMLAAQINIVNEQSEIAKEINEGHVRKIEEANMEVMKNIKRLNIAIKQHQDRIKHIQKVGRNRQNKGGKSYVGFV